MGAFAREPGESIHRQDRRPAGADQAAEIAAVLDEAAGLLTAGDIDGAAQLFAAVLQADPDNIQAIAGLADCMIGANQHQRARELLTQLPEELSKAPEVQALLKRLDQIEEARKLGDPVALEHTLSLHPDDHAARMKLAKIRNVEGRREEAAEHLLLIMKRDRSFEDERCTQAAFAVLRSLGAEGSGDRDGAAQALVDPVFVSSSRP